MSAKSILLCFQLVEGSQSVEEVQNKLKGIPAICFAGNEYDVTTKQHVKSGGSLMLAMADDGSHMVLREYETGLVTVDVQRLVSDNAGPNLLQISMVKALESKIKQHLGQYCKYSRSVMGQITRGEVCPYYSTGADLLCEYNNVKLVYEKESEWQNIKIYYSEEFGNALWLDDDVMIAEGDLIYTHTLLGVERNDFRDKTVLILGGGDGGLLYELLNRNVGFVLMAEIDEEVIKACRKHMPKVCYDALDKYEGPHHKIHIGDCMKVLRDSLQTGRKFDYVINDLTEFLVTEEADQIHTYDHEMTSTILGMSFQILNPGGKYLSRGNTVSAKSFRNKFEDNIRSLNLEYKTFQVDVPSFRERYCLYEVWKP